MSKKRSPARRRQQGQQSLASVGAVPASRSASVSACMIVKNEEQNLGRCLGSLQRAVDEIVVVDTGSTDQTVQIAEQYGARVFSFAWCDDFAAARNESLSHATGHFIMWIDADDEFFEAEPGALRRLCAAMPASASGYWLTCHSLMDESGEQESVLQQWRIFPNNTGIRFRGRIHEQATPPNLKQPLQLINQDQVWVRHWGYAPGPQVAKGKGERNRRLLALAIQDDPDDPYNYYSLGKQYLWEKDFAPALRVFEKAIELWDATGRPDATYAPSLFALSAFACSQLGEVQRALEIEAQMPGHLVSSDLLCACALCCLRLGRQEDAIARLNRAWSDPAVRISFESDPGTWSWKPLLMLSNLHLTMGQRTKAHELAAKAMESIPRRPDIVLSWASVMAKQGDTDQATRWAREVIAGKADAIEKARARRLLLDIGRDTDPRLVLEALAGPAAGIESPQAIILRAQAHAQLGDVQQQYDLLDAACREQPAESTIRLALAELLEAQGFLAESLNVLAAGMEQVEPPAQLYTQMARVLAKLGRLEDAANARTMADRIAQPVA